MDTVKFKKIQEAELSAKSPSTVGEETIQPPIKYSYQKGKTKKPKRNKSAFILFSVEMRAKLKSDSQDQLNSNEMMVKLANLWKDLPKAEREKYHSEAKSDKMRYLQELDNFSKAYPLESIHNKTKKNHVKKPCSSYAIFLKEMKGIIKEKSPDLKMADVLKIVSEKWKNLTEDEKQVYQNRAKMEKELARAKLGESLQKGNTPNNISNECLGIHKKIKTEKNSAYHHKDMKHSGSQQIPLPKLEANVSHFPLFEPILTAKSSDISTKAETPLMEGLTRPFDLSFLPLARSQSAQVGQLGFHLNDNMAKKSNMDDEGRVLISLFDHAMKKSSELLMGLLSFSLPTERFDTLDFFEPTGNNEPVIPKPSFNGNHNEALNKSRPLTIPFQEILNSTILDALRNSNQNSEMVPENVNANPALTGLSLLTQGK